MIGVVSQEPVLFNGTIRENIRLGREGIDDQAIFRAATLANAHDFIMSHPKGYDTLLGAGGVSLSGGQKQRIAIARAVATEPRILLLDEATSALDSHSERIVQDALMRAAAGRTTVVVAHRLASIRNVTRIFVIEDGQVVEEGSYNELCAKEDGKFAAMVALQRIEEKTKADSEGDWNEKIDEDSKGFPIGNARSVHGRHPRGVPSGGCRVLHSRSSTGLRHDSWRRGKAVVGRAETAIGSGQGHLEEATLASSR